MGEGVHSRSSSLLSKGSPFDNLYRPYICIHSPSECTHTSTTDTLPLHETESGPAWSATCPRRSTTRLLSVPFAIVYQDYLRIGGVVLLTIIMFHYWACSSLWLRIGMKQDSTGSTGITLIHLDSKDGALPRFQGQGICSTAPTHALVGSTVVVLGSIAMAAMFLDVSTLISLFSPSTTAYQRQIEAVEAIVSKLERHQPKRIQRNYYDARDGERADLSKGSSDSVLLDESSSTATPKNRGEAFQCGSGGMVFAEDDPSIRFGVTSQLFSRVRSVILDINSTEDSQSDGDGEMRPSQSVPVESTAQTAPRNAQDAEILRFLGQFQDNLARLETVHQRRLQERKDRTNKRRAAGKCVLTAKDSREYNSGGARCRFLPQ